jgi:diguanylate cyclase (GGDEF)-like protein
MEALSLTSRLKRGLAVKDWAFWVDCPPLQRWYVGGIIGFAIAVVGVLAARTDWRVSNVVEFLVLTCCGMVSMASTPKIAYLHSGATRDFSGTWILPTAILLPPIYAALIPIPIVAVLQFYVHRGRFYRRVFSAASLGLSYVAVSLAFQVIPRSFAGGSVGLGLHAFTWCIAVGICEVLAVRVQHFLIVGAVKIANPAMRMFAGEFDRETLQELFVEIDLAVLIAIAVALSPTLVVIALPTVLLVRRYLVHPVLVAQSRIDSKTGLLNVSTWETEAETELSRSVRTRSPVTLLLIDIDHFKRVNDTHGHLVGDKVLKAVAEALSGDLRPYDRAGRFGGEEFVILLAQTTEADAKGIADRLRVRVADLAVPISDRPDSATVGVTISLGVAAMDAGQTRELNDLLAAADSALYGAKRAGRNRIAVAAAELNMLDAELNGHSVVVVQVDPTGASLGPATSL